MFRNIINYRTIEQFAKHRHIISISRTMSTAATIQLNPNVHPVYFHQDLANNSAKKASELLQVNHDNHHIFFNADGFHNHIVHHLLAIFALKGNAEDINKAYTLNQGYQRSAMNVDKDVVSGMSDSQKFISYLGQEKYYPAFLEFFGQQIQQSTWQDVVQKYVFSGSELAETMLVRMFGGFLHPIIHLGYGIEFQQPAIIAEALAQAAVHDDYLKKLFFPAEEAAKKLSNKPSKSIVELLDAIHSDPEMRDSARWSDGNKLRDGVLVRAGQRTVDLTSQYHLSPALSDADLKLKTAEMINAVCYYTAAAQRPGKKIKWDFYFMHCVNSSIFWPSFIAQPWLSAANKARVLEWKVRIDLAMYASRRCPDFRFAEVQSYTPRRPQDTWADIIARVIQVEDDGHSAKLIRALAYGEQICGEVGADARAEFRAKSGDWIQMAQSVIDGVEGAALGKDESRWIRSAGFDQAWENEPARL